MSPKVHINILSFNAPHFLERAINSCLKQDYDNLSISVFDNNSSDDVSSILKKYENRIRVIYSPANLGFSKAHNLVIRESQADFFIPLNQDCVLREDFVREAVNFLLLEPEVAAVQPKVLKFNSNRIDSSGLIILKNRRVLSRGQGEEDRGQYEKKEEIFGFDGAAPVLRRSALEDAKIKEEYFDEDFFMYKEDVDFSWRLRLLGWKIFYLPQVLAWHERGSGEGVFYSWRDIIKARKHLSSFAKHHSFKNQRLLKLKNDFFDWQNFPKVIFNELGSLAYALVFEKRTIPCLLEIIKLAPRMLEKRKLILSKRRIKNYEIKKWFI